MKCPRDLQSVAQTRQPAGACFQYTALDEKSGNTAHPTLGSYSSTRTNGFSVDKAKWKGKCPSPTSKNWQTGKTPTWQHVYKHFERFVVRQMHLRKKWNVTLFASSSEYSALLPHQSVHIRTGVACHFCCGLLVCFPCRSSIHDRLTVTEDQRRTQTDS